MAIFLAYSTSGVTSAEKVCRGLKMAAILKILKYWTQLQFDLGYEKIVPNYAIKSIFHDDDVTDDVTGWPKIGPLYSFINEITTFFTRMWKMILSSATPTVCLEQKSENFKVTTWHYRCRHHLKNYCIWDNLQCCLLFCDQIYICNWTTIQ